MNWKLCLTKVSSWHQTTILSHRVQEHVDSSVKWHETEHIFFLKTEVAKASCRTCWAQAKSWLFPMEQICQLTEVLLKKPVHTLTPNGVLLYSSLISRELVWMISIPFPSLAVSNSYFVKLHSQNFFFFWSLLSCFHTTCCASKCLGMSHSSCVWVSWMCIWFFLLEAVSFLWAGYNLQ